MRRVGQVSGKLFALPQHYPHNRCFLSCLVVGFSLETLSAPSPPTLAPAQRRAQKTIAEPGILPGGDTEKVAQRRKFPHVLQWAVWPILPPRRGRESRKTHSENGYEWRLGRNSVGDADSEAVGGAWGAAVGAFLPRLARTRRRLGMPAFASRVAGRTAGTSCRP